MVSGLISFKRRFPWIWRGVEGVNGMLFRLRYSGFSRVAIEVLKEYAPEGFSFSLATPDDASSLSRFLMEQPEDSFCYFRPHNFDEKTIHRLIKGSSFLVMKVTGEGGGDIRGYFFLRCFFTGRAFAGLIVDSESRNKGLGSVIWSACVAICQRTGLRMFATIDEKNLPSLKSCDNGTEIVARKKIYDDYLLLECKPKNKNNQVNIISPLL